MVFQLVIKYFWVLCIGVNIVNAAIWRHRGKVFSTRTPELKEGYASLSRGYAFWTSIPWIVMGVGIMMGKVPSLFHYFRPKDGNPFVIAWFVSIFVLWLIGFFWLFVRNGAKQLIKHPGLFNKEISSTGALKVLYVIALLCCIVAFVFMLIMEVPITF